MAVLSPEGRTKLTPAPVAVTDDTVTLMGAAHWGSTDDAAGDRDGSADDVATTTTQTAIPTDAVRAAGRTAGLFMHLMMHASHPF